MVQDLLGRHIDLMVLDIASSMPTIVSKKVRPLVVFSRQRLASLPSVPTIFELGLGEMEAAAWQGLAVPAGTPEAIRRRLSDALAAAVNHPDVQKKLAEYGAEPVSSTAAGMKELWDKDHMYWAALIRSRGITAE
jgi:tripartite-type tricarboxylate transporter receptor subunit TctC